MTSSQNRGGFTRRQLVAWSAAAGSLSLLPRLARAAVPDLKGATLTIATYKGQDQTLLEAAGVADTPYRVEYIEFGSGNLIIQAIHAGVIDLGSMSEIPPIFAATQGASDLRLIAVAQGDVNNQVVLVPKGSPVRSIAELKGKRVGYVKATTTHYYLLKMLEEAGLGFGDIDAVNLSPPDGRAAFEGGHLDAWAIYGYSVQLTIAAIGARVLKTANGYLSGNYLYAAHERVVSDPSRHAAVADYLRRQQKAFLWREANKERWSEIFAASLHLPSAIILDQLKTESQPYRLVPVDDQAIRSEQAVADSFADAGLIPARVDVSPLWDRSFNSVITEASL